MMDGAILFILKDFMSVPLGKMFFIYLYQVSIFAFFNVGINSVASVFYEL